MKRKWKWLIGIAIALCLAGVALVFLARQHASKIEPYIRDQAVAYLRDRFGADVEIREIRIGLPAFSPVQLYLTKGRGATASVTANGVVLRLKDRPNATPLFRMNTIRFEVDVGHMLDEQKTISAVYMDGMEIVIPPKGERPKFPKGADSAKTSNQRPNVIIREVLITNAHLVIEPRDKTRKPLDFDLHRIRLQDAGMDKPLPYEADLRNAKPPGEIHAKGTFGPWVTGEPGESHLDGDYRFEHANLAVFSAIGGMLNSTGSFTGVLNQVEAKGEATVPDFYLKSVGNKMPLYARFETTVDGTNGNTILKPVHARLGKTEFTTGGGIVKHDGDQRKTIDLDVNMPAGNMEDILRLAMKGNEPFMAGTLNLKTTMTIPPLSGKVVEKLRLKGNFSIQNGKFLRTTIQDRIDQMSRQAQGQPKNETIDEVVSDMSGRFAMANEKLTFSYLTFSIPGADMAIAGDFNLDTEEVDFKGELKLQAKLSQTQVGWKRWALKPVDPFFAKKGAGLYTMIQITGTRKDPKFARLKE